MEINHEELFKKISDLVSNCINQHYTEKVEQIVPILEGLRLLFEEHEASLSSGEGTDLDYKITTRFIENIFMAKDFPGEEYKKTKGEIAFFTSVALKKYYSLEHADKWCKHYGWEDVVFVCENAPQHSLRKTKDTNLLFFKKDKKCAWYEMENGSLGSTRYYLQGKEGDKKC